MTPITASDTEAAARTFSALLRDVEQQFSMVRSEITDLEAEQSDLLHRIERPECKYEERARIATELQRVRKYRRELKDWLRTMRPLEDYYTSDKGKNLNMFVASYLGAARTAYRAEAARTKEDDI